MGVSQHELHESYRVSAEIVKIYGETYLPIFRRIHEEISKRKADDLLIQQAIKVADSTT